MLTMNVETPSLKALAVHYVGSKNNLEPLHLSRSCQHLNKELSAALQNGFLSKFKLQHEQFSFQHTTGLQYNEVYQFCKQLFDDPGLLAQLSAAMAKHLYQVSTHPKVKGGELYVALFDGLPVASRMQKAVGIFKTENKALFLDVQHQGSNFDVAMKEGAELTKIDKGCLVLNSQAEHGFDVLLFDNQNRGEEAQYWKEKFLGVAPQKNEYHNTNHFLSLTKQFITGQLEEELVLDKTTQVQMLNRSIDYFKEREIFSIDEFQTHVFENEAVIESFRNFGARYTEANDFDIAATFNISADAVKKQMRVFKSVVKLDKNFHIYIHGRTDLIERGVDENGRKFYKIYYQSEA